jgi:hypothetical protein
MLRDNSAIADMTARLRAEDFYVSGHQNIFEGLATLMEQGKAADFITLSDWLKGKQCLEDAGGPSYLVDLWDAGPSGANLRQYVEIVLRFSAARRIIHDSHDCSKSAAKPGADPLQVAADLRERMDSLLRRKSDHAAGVVPKNMADVPPAKVRWLWDGRVPLRAITIVDGDPALGKSTVTIDIAARVSRGWRMPPDGGAGDGIVPGGVLLLSAEDDAETTIRPRLDAAGANASRVQLLEAIRHGDAPAPPVLPSDLDKLDRLVGQLGVVLIVIDPFMAYLDSHVDAHRDQDVRRCLHRLKELAERKSVAIVLIRHLNKLHGGPALYRGGGSIGIIGAARSALCVGRDPTDPTVFVLAGVKSNLGPMPRAMRYQLERVGDVARVGWIGECDLLADEILDGAGAGTKRTQAEHCAQAMRNLLAGAPMRSAELDEQLHKLGFGRRAIQAARKDLNVRCYKSSFTGEWIAELPQPGTAAEADL